MARAKLLASYISTVAHLLAFLIIGELRKCDLITFNSPADHTLPCLPKMPIMDISTCSGVLFTVLVNEKFLITCSVFESSDTVALQKWSTSARIMWV